MIDRSAVGFRVPDACLLVTRSRLRDFAVATGETNPVYTDLAAAEGAGHRDLPVPATFIFGIDHEGEDPQGYLVELGADLRNVLHGEQAFNYRRMAYAGDVLYTRGVISDIYEKKGGALTFIVKESAVTNQDDEVVAELHLILVVQNPGREAAS